MSTNKAGFEIKDGIAVLKFDNPPVNSLGLELRQAIVEGIERANADPKIQAIVLVGAGAGFSGGADIREFGTPRASTQPHLMTVIATVEGSAKPVIAAIGGVCMGGGLELALGCHYRVAAAGAKIALPEVKLGLLPGAGGTQRLPRVIGAEAALNMIVSGATVPSEKLRGTPLFDAFADGDLLDAALGFARKVVTEKLGVRRVRDLKVTMPNHEAFFQFARNTAKAVAGHYPAPVACVEAVAAAFDRPFDAGIKRERELFTTLMLSPESAALRHVFQAERAASHILDVPNDTPTRPIRKVGIIGAGTMGGGISMSLINAGIPVVLLEMKQEALDKGLATMRRNYGGALKKGTLTEAALDQRMALVTPTLDYAQLKDVDLVIEAVFEARSGRAARRHSCLQHLRVESGPDRAVHQAPARCHRFAFFQSRERHAPAGDRAWREDGEGRAGNRDAIGQEDRQGRGHFRRLRWLHRQSHGRPLRRGRSRSHHGRRAAQPG
jgi:3-hydroxyacyl-CoA dehydrogenase